ncbi:DNA polymerase III, subunit gamma and tau [Fusobacterium animalis 7_1]|uniref:DNA polymerase III subunit gamma/tau n=1 Tax=Fusobacterium animalis 7_1 TaxID=457405 RepID=A0A140PVC7_9FUSO|nr:MULTISPECIES: DNA polymerase III subunit gamma/tau [Fusobacterium]ALF22360.1 DNA polymerase III subunit gamma/tau [Fusobacterium animalis]EEO43473.1 DNA polymerase III, subunit gamma and tau [Fusobacterium animalis 7_1]EHG19166.2 DNA polymerase III, subunit gamma and tau [Fusobacterium polymorphum F0401]ERT42158.1 DNA polymerase III, subunit gamma and tau [Fusobacterium nucleatum CTI-1]BEO90286.1 DNA polymerase III subunit gamma/tau [Fusobacterium nucleatum]
MHITLYRKYRPSSFSEVSGENEIVKSLKLSLKNKSMAHAYLFSGPRGVGKTTIARLIAKGVNCLNLKENGEPCNECKNCKAINEGRFSDLIEIDAASNRSIDEIRSLKEKINYQPVEGLKKVYIIDEAHMLTKEAFNALLKTLEEPPAHVIFILATTELEKILPTIISRCQRYDFKPLDLEEMKAGLEHILKEENLSMTDDVYPVIYENSSGSMRDSISILERLIVTANGKEINLKIAEDTLGITPSSRIKIFLNKILNENEYDIINELESLANESFDIELFFKDLAKYCKNAILKKELDIEKGLKIISTIYDVIGKFKFEDDKKLVGYVIVAEILSNTKQTVVKVVTTTQTNVNPTNSSIEEIKKDKVNIKLTISDVKNNWNSILAEANNKRLSYRAFLMGANPVKIENNTLFINYDRKFKFAKEQMETPEYSQEFTKIVREFFNEDNLEIKYEVVGQKKDEENNNSEFFKKIENYFKGEN